MCLFNSSPPPVQMPKETQAMQSPDGGAVRADQRRAVTDRIRSAAQTVLTSGMGTTTNASTGQNTVLGA